MPRKHLGLGAQVRAGRLDHRRLDGVRDDLDLAAAVWAVFEVNLEHANTVLTLNQAAATDTRFRVIPMPSRPNPTSARLSGSGTVVKVQPAVPGTHTTRPSA